jgi:hypothetical protein
VGSLTVTSSDGTIAHVELALHEPTAREVARTLLHGAIRPGARSGDDRGGPVGDGPTSLRPEAHSLLTSAPERRDATVSRVRSRFQRALDDGDLPPHADPGLLARQLVTVSDGIEVQASSGVGAAELHEIVDVALQAWPSVWTPLEQEADADVG